MTENPGTLIESGFASRASTHKKKKHKSQTSQKFDSCSLHSLGQLPKRADVSEIGWFTVCNLKVPRKQHRFTECNTGLQNTTGSYFSSPNATQGCKPRQVRRGPISGPLSDPSGSPRSPAEPHPPSLAWVETPLPLGPLPLPPGPLNAKHSKRAQGAVFNGTHSPVRSEPSSPPLATARVSTASWRPSHRARTSTSGPGESRQVLCRWS